MKVVFRPEQMTPAELYEGFRWAYRETFTLRNILHRTIGAGMNFPIAFMGNLTYRLFVKKLQRTRGFEMPLPERTLPARQLVPLRVKKEDRRQEAAPAA